MSILWFIHKTEKIAEKGDTDNLINKVDDAMVTLSSSIPSKPTLFVKTANTLLSEYNKLYRRLKELKLYDYLKRYILPVMDAPSTPSSDQIRLSNYESAYEKYYSSNYYLHPKEAFENPAQKVVDFNCYVLKQATRDILSIYNVNMKKLFESVSELMDMNNFQTDHIEKWSSVICDNNSNFLENRAIKASIIRDAVNLLKKRESGRTLSETCQTHYDHAPDVLKHVAIAILQIGQSFEIKSDATLYLVDKDATIVPTQ